MRVPSSFPFRSTLRGLKRRVLPPPPEPVIRTPEFASLIAAGDWRGAAAAIAESPHPIDREPLHFVRSFAERSAGTEAVFLHHHTTSGRVEHYHHYVGAVLLPVMQLIDIGAIGDVLCMAPDCGPMNPHLAAIAAHYGFGIDFYPPDLSAVIAGNSQHRHLHLPPYDKSNDSDSFLRRHQLARVRRVAFAVAGIVDGDRSADWTKPSVLLINRAAPHDFYASDRYRYEVNREGLAGSARRSIPNIDEVQASLAASQEVRLVHLEELAWPDQVRAFNAATAIIGQHGAGLNGLLWSRPGGLVLEIIPVGNLGDQFTFFSNIADRLSVRHYHVVQATPHAPVDAALLASLLAAERRDRAA